MYKWYEVTPWYFWWGLWGAIVLLIVGIDVRSWSTVLASLMMMGLTAWAIRTESQHRIRLYRRLWWCSFGWGELNGKGFER